MGRTLMRGLVGLVGLLAVALAVRFWMEPAKIAAQLGLQGVGPLGAATLRADVGGFFGVAGLLALGAAIRNDGRQLSAPFLMVCLALAGRVLSAFVDGAPPLVIPPMVIEAVLAIIFFTGRRVLPARI